MDRRSWLWRRKSSDKSPTAETDSSESLSSHSERYSDDQALAQHNSHSPEPEVTSKASSGVEETAAPSIEQLPRIDILSHKLSEAIANIRAKEDLVKQHSKVAEEAVSGWEKAEAEVVVLKRHAEITTEKNAALEERVMHLDGALKECLRQLRLAKDDHEQKIHETITKKLGEFESIKSELENQLANLRNQLETATTDAVTSTFPDLCIKLEAAERENSSLKLQLVSREEELKLRISERDLSIHAAEIASKQHLESIKKVAKLEAECRMLKMQTRKAATTFDQRSLAASSTYVESFADSQSDSAERLSTIDSDSFKTSVLELTNCEPGVSDLSGSSFVAENDLIKIDKSLRRNSMAISDDIYLMNDFAEMEKLAGLPEAVKGSSGSNGKNSLKTEVRAVANGTVELEEKLEKMNKENMDLKMSLSECQLQLQASKDQLEDKAMKLIELQIQLVSVNEMKRTAEAELQATKFRLDKSADELTRAEDCVMELNNQLSMVNIEKESIERDLKAANEKLVKLSKYLKEEKINVAELSTKLASANKSMSKIQVKLETTNEKKETAESRLKAAENELQALKSTIHNLEGDIQKERTLSEDAIANCRKLNAEISRLKLDSQLWRTATFGEFKVNQEQELAVAANKFSDCQKTIASLGEQLKCLARLEDSLFESDT